MRRQDNRPMDDQFQEEEDLELIDDLLEEDFEYEPIDDEAYDEYVRQNKGRKKRGGGRTASSGAGRQTGRAPKKKSGKWILFLIAELLVLAVVVVIFKFVIMAEKIEKVDSVEVEEHVQESISEEVKVSVEEGQMKGFRNIAFFGVDSTKGALRDKTRSDSIMIASINQDTGVCKLVSVYRDTYLNLGNDDYSKCNAAYAAGGPEQAIKMLNTNLDLNITDFVTVGFGGLTAAVDALGGLDIDVDEAERPHLNSYQWTMSKELNVPYQEITQTGLLHLNGVQTTAYCRIRYTAGDDFKRAARQREVLRAIFEKAKTKDIATLTKMVEGVLGQVYTSLSTSELIEIASSLNEFQLVEENPDDKYGSGFPTEEHLATGYIGTQSCVIPVDLTQNVIWLHQYLFEDEEYEVSAKVKECSDRVTQITGYGPAN